MGETRPGNVKVDWKADALFLATPPLLALLAAWLRYGEEAFAPRSNGLLVLACGLAGGACYVACRRSGLTLGLVLAIAILGLFRVLPWWGGLDRSAMAGTVWGIAAGLCLLGSLLFFRASRAWMGFGRFVLVAVLMGLGFVAAGLLFGLLHRVDTGALSMRIQFGVGSLGGAAMGLGIEIVERLRVRRLRRSFAGVLAAVLLGAAAGL
jgi:hypothetical protein